MDLKKEDILSVLKSIGKYAPEAYEKMTEEQLLREYERLTNSQTN